jgi:hypothetical protein
MGTQENLNIQRKKTAVIAAILAIILFLTGTFAWYSISQRALNQVELTANSGGRIHDDFNKQDILATRSNRANKDIYAENFGENDLVVRIKLSEYLEVDGEAVTGGARDDRSTWIPYVLDNNEEARNYVTWTMGGSKIFLPTFNLDQNNLSTDAKGDAIDEITGTATGIGDATHRYFEPAGTHFEADGTRLQSPSATSHASKSTLLPDRAVISMDAWLALDEEDKIGQYWVIDADGWAYWADMLRPSTATSLLLNELDIQSRGIELDMYYAIDVVGEFATESDVDKFYNGESDHGNASSQGQELINTILGSTALEPSFIPREPGSVFRDSNDIDWRVLVPDDGYGNALIITEYIYNFNVQYNATNTWSPFEDSNLRNDPTLGMDVWYESEVGENIKAIALDYDYPPGAYPGGAEKENPNTEQWNINSNLDIARTVAGHYTTEGNGQTFALSISEVNQYRSNGALNIAAGSNSGVHALWWLRSAGQDNITNTAAVVVGLGDTFINPFPANHSSHATGFRAALWVRR